VPSNHKKHTLVAIVQDQPGVMSRVVSLFRRRGFNIDEIAVGPTETPPTCPAENPFRCLLLDTPWVKRAPPGKPNR